MRQRKFSTTNEPGGANRGNTIMVTPISRHGFRTGKCSDIRFSCKHHSTITWIRLCALLPTNLDKLSTSSYLFGDSSAHCLVFFLVTHLLEVFTYRCLQVSVENLGIAARNEHRRDDEQLLTIRTYCQPQTY